MQNWNCPLQRQGHTVFCNLVSKYTECLQPGYKTFTSLLIWDTTSPPERHLWRKKQHISFKVLLPSLYSHCFFLVLWRHPVVLIGGGSWRLCWEGRRGHRAQHCDGTVMMERFALGERARNAERRGLWGALLPLDTSSPYEAHKLHHSSGMQDALWTEWPRWRMHYG